MARKVFIKSSRIYCRKNLFKHFLICYRYACGWMDMQNNLACTTRVCTYARAHAHTHTRAHTHTHTHELLLICAKDTKIN